MLLLVSLLPVLSILITSVLFKSPPTINDIVFAGFIIPYLHREESIRWFINRAGAIQYLRPIVNHHRITSTVNVADQSAKPTNYSGPY